MMSSRAVCVMAKSRTEEDLIVSDMHVSRWYYLVITILAGITN